MPCSSRLSGRLHSYLAAQTKMNIASKHGPKLSRFCASVHCSGKREDRRDPNHAHDFYTGEVGNRPTAAVQVTDSTRPPWRKVDSQSARRLLWR